MTLINHTVGELLEEQIRLYPNNEAVIYPELDIRLTYKQFNDEVNKVARRLMDLGIKKGDHVAMWADNKPEWIISLFATAKIGAILVTVNTSYQAEELEYLMKQSESSTIIMAESFKGTSYVDILRKIYPDLDKSEKGNASCDSLPHLKNIIVISESSYDYCYTWNELIKKEVSGTKEDLSAQKRLLDTHDVINMQYTSGTTGFPKGVMLSHHNIVNNGKQISDCMKLTHEDRLCIPVPFFHCFGCVLGILAAVSKGATMVIVEQFDAETVLQAVEQEKCTALHGVPTMFIAELNHPNFKKYDVSSLRTGIMAGSTCPIEVMRDVMDKMGANEITIAYGLTESSPVFTQTKTDDPIELKVSTVGRPHPNVEVKVLVPGTDQEQEIGIPGELCTRGYHIMKGYYNDPEATKEAIDKDGWLHTGDLAILHESGYFEITGRMKDMIIRGGENIYPREIEEFLYKHPDVLDVQVVGVPDSKFGEEVMAYIILQEGKQATEEDIKAYCYGKISRFKIPRYIDFVTEYPMTASGKIQKYKLRERAIKQLSL